jgi:thioredoxin 2
VVQVVCPSCLTANRVPGERLGEGPSCGKCRAPLLAGEPVALDDSSFDALVGRTELPVVVDFWAPWCGPCRAMAPHFERAAALLKDRVRFAKVNTDEAPGIAGRMAVRAIPTLVLFKAGAEVKRVSGVLDARALVQWIETEGATA